MHLPVVRVVHQVGMVTAVDADGPQHNSVGYSFQSGNIATDTFAIDQNTGLISTRSPLDRESHGLYHLIVTAYDRKLTSLSSTVTAIVQVDRRRVKYRCNKACSNKRFTPADAFRQFYCIGAVGHFL